MIVFLAGVATGYLLFTKKGQEHGKNFTDRLNKAGNDLVAAFNKKVSKPQPQQQEVVLEPVAEPTQQAEQSQL